MQQEIRQQQTTDSEEVRTNMGVLQRDIKDLKKFVTDHVPSSSSVSQLETHIQSQLNQHTQALSELAESNQQLLQQIRNLHGTTVKMAQG